MRGMCGHNKNTNWRSCCNCSCARIVELVGYAELIKIAYLVYPLQFPLTKSAYRRYSYRVTIIHSREKTIEIGTDDGRGNLLQRHPQIHQVRSHRHERRTPLCCRAVQLGLTTGTGNGPFRILGVRMTWQKTEWTDSERLALEVQQKKAELQLFNRIKNVLLADLSELTDKELARLKETLKAEVAKRKRVVTK
jgi:hypothetical protein